MTQSQKNRSTLKRYAWLSIAAALVTMGLKATAYFLTGSVGLLSDAFESLVNLAGGIMLLSMLSIATRPSDDNHAYGHSKAEYFSSGFEGSLILIAAGSIIYTAVKRLIEPQPLEQLGIGLVVLFLASMLNLGVSLILKQAGKKLNAISLTADSQHLMTDVWTSGGVLVGVGLVALTNWQPLDSIVAILAAINILWTG
jgi:cation diffusion facilitator family transporter